MKRFAILPLLAPLLLCASFPLGARASEDEPEIVAPIRIVETSGAETEVNAARAKALHAAWLRTLAEHPENPLLAKAERSGAFRKHPEKMRCWVTGFSAIFSAQTGVCRSAGRKYAFSALGFGFGSELHTGRLRLVSNLPFPDTLSIGGDRASAHVLFGIEAYDLRSAKTGIDIEGHGIGVGIGGSVEFVWVTLSRLN